MTVLQRTLSEKRRLIVPLVVAVVANVVLYAVVVFPLGRQVVSAEGEARAQHEAVNRSRLDYLSAKATVTGKQQADSALQKSDIEIIRSGRNGHAGEAQEDCEGCSLDRSSHSLTGRRKPALAP